MRPILPVLLALLLLGCGTVCAQQAPNGPWNNDLALFQSTDGLTFTRVERFVERGGVPCLLKDGKGRLISAFQWFPANRQAAFDRIAVRISADKGKTWGEPTPVEISGFPANADRPCDPTLALLEDGRIRMYFTSHERGVRNGATYSAISADGVHYTFEPGMRFGNEGFDVLDCAVAPLGKKWHYYSPIQEKRGYGYHAVSDDGLKFTRQADVRIAGGGAWLGAVLPTKDGLRFFGTGDGVWSAVSRDGSTWELEPGRRALGADPGVADAGDGRMLLVATVGKPPREAGGRPALAANEEFVYVRRDGILYVYDAKTLRLVKQAPLPDE